MIFVTALMLAQAPAVASAQPVQPAPIVVKKEKKAQVCQYVDDTGSRMRHRVCHDSGDSSQNPNVADATTDPGMFHSPPPAQAPGGVGAPPR